MPLLPAYQFARSRIPHIPWCNCAAKTTNSGQAGTTVAAHCVNVGRVGEALFPLLPACVRERLPPAPGLPLSVHDVGKVSPGYQLKYFAETVVRRFAPALCGQASFCTKHATVSAAAIDRFLASEPLSSPVSVAAAAHHGTLDRSYPSDTAETFGGDTWAVERERLISHLASVFGGTLSAEATSHPALLTGLTCVADWIGSDDSFFPADDPPVVKGDPALTARQAVDACGFRPAPLRKDLSFQDIFGFSPRDAQTQFIAQAVRPGLYVLEAPMGIGKTEAALYATYRLMESGAHHGFYFALPTRLTSDRIHARVTDFLSKITDAAAAPRLAHGMAWLKEFESGGRELAPGHPWFSPLKRALLFPYAVGTIDQALLGVLNVRHSFVRLFGLAGKVVILDEVHSYDMFTGTLLDTLVERLLSVGCTVLVLSATLTGSRRTRLAPSLRKQESTSAYPLLTGIPLAEGTAFATPLPVPPSNDIRIRMEDWDQAAVADESVSAALRGECVVCIANTVAKAQAWYRAVKNAMQDGAFPVGILHARFPFFRRDEIEAWWLTKLGKTDTARPRGCVLIATQILEQSVDIDADWMISELAPTDMLLQRMGRLWRHARPTRPRPAPEFVVVTPDPSASATAEDLVAALGRENCCVYAPYVLLKTHAAWKPRQAVTLPTDIRALIEATYDERDPPPGSALSVLKARLDRQRERLRHLALSALDTVTGLPTGTDDENVATRHSDLPTTTVLLLAGTPDVSNRGGRARVRLLDGSVWTLDARTPNFTATRAIHANTLSLARYLLPEGRNARASVPWLGCHFHVTPVVLVCGENGALTCADGGETTLRYSLDYGVWRADTPLGSQPAKPHREPSVSQTEDDAFDPFNAQW